MSAISLIALVLGVSSYASAYHDMQNILECVVDTFWRFGRNPEAISYPTILDFQFLVCAPLAADFPHRHHRDIVGANSGGANGGGASSEWASCGWQVRQTGIEVTAGSSGKGFLQSRFGGHCSNGHRSKDRRPGGCRPDDRRSGERLGLSELSS